MAYIVRLGPEYFPDASRNRPIRYGRIYIGLADTDPTIEANQQDVTALLEDGSEISMSQPILTSAGGIPVYNGSPVSLKVASRYSITVLNQSGSQEYYIPINFAADDTEITISATGLSADDGIEIVVNDAGLDCDFRVESTISQCGLFLEASSGNIGINYCDLDAWTSGYTGVQIRETGNISASSSTLNISQNAFRGSSWTYQTSNQASRYSQGLGLHFFQTAAYGTEETAISWINQLTLTATEANFNDDGEDIDFRVESDTREYAFLVDGATGTTCFNANDPPAWASTLAAIQIGNMGAIASHVTYGAGYRDISISFNDYYDGSNYRYKEDQYVSRYYQAEGGHYFRAAAFGTSGDIIAYNNLLDLQITSTVFNSSLDDLDFTINTTASNALFIEGSSANIGFGVTDFGGGSGGVIGLKRSTAPTGPPTEGGVLFFDISDNTLKFHDMFGNVNELAPIDNIPQGIDIVFNEAGGDFDFRIESDTVEYAFFLDGATGTISLGNSTILDWADAYAALQFGGNAGIFANRGESETNNLFLSQNSFLSGTGWEFINIEGAASLLKQNSGEHTFYSSAINLPEFTELVKTYSDDIQGSDNFHACSISADATIMVVGAELEDTAAANAGKVYTFEWNSGTVSWDEINVMYASDATGGDGFGSACSISGDGGRLAVGARYEDSGGTNAGKVYIYEWNSGTVSWDEIDTIVGSGSNNNFGTSVALNYDGTKLAVGRPNYSAAYTYIGMIQYYEWNGGTLTFDSIENLTINTGAGSVFLGSSCSLNSDGTKLLAGARGAYANGVVFYYEWGGASWGSPLQTITASDGSSGDGFGTGCSISGDGNFVAVGASYEDSQGFNAGKVYTFEWNGVSFDEVAMITASDAAVDDYYGSACSFNSDGSRLAVGAIQEGAVGAVYYYSGETQTDIIWTNQFQLKIDETIFNEDGADIDYRVESDINANALFIEGSSSNIGFGITTFGGGSGGVLALSNATAPTSNPTGGGLVYVNSGDNNLYYRDASGNIEQLSGYVFAGTDSGNIVFNESGGDYDFRIETITDVNAFVIDGGTGDISFSNGSGLLSMTSSEALFNTAGIDYDFRIRSLIYGNSFLIDGASGTIGFCTTDAIKAWRTDYVAAQFGYNASLMADTAVGSNSFDMIQNAYYDAVGWKYQHSYEASRYFQSIGTHSFYSAVSGVADGAITWRNLLEVGYNSIVFNEDGADIDLRVESDTISNAIYMDGATGIVSLPACYSHDMNGETYRDLLINDSGELGYDSSTIRKKTNVVDMENIDWLYDLRPVNFEYKKRDDKGAYLNKGNGIKKYGLIAEELESVNSDFVFYDEDGRTEGIHYREFIPVLIKALQDQKYEIERLKMRLTEVA